ncbi:unnamed protein product [Ilex paraguariensis]|uniref:Uncharacterized protein n=1 Tax=Ilex paraguariensis TaxID=185542 RepID=A0ABC8SPL7_9AQUA
MTLKFGCIITVVISSETVAKEVLQKHDLLFSTRAVPDSIHAKQHNEVSMESVMLLEAVRRLKVQELLAYVHESCQAGTAREFKEVVRSNMEVDGKSKLVDYVPVLKWIDLQGIRLRMTGFFGKVISVFDSGSKHIAIKEKSCFSSNRRCTGYSSRQRGQLAFDTDVGFTPDVALDGWLRSFTPLLGSLKMDSLQRIWTWNTSLGLSAEGSQPTCYPNASSENRLTVFSCAGAPQFPASITYRCNLIRNLTHLIHIRSLKSENRLTVFSCAGAPQFPASITYRYLGYVGEIDWHLLDRILPHCTVDQLIHIENSTEERDLSPVTDKLWKRFYEIQFGAKSTNLVVERMKQKKVTFRWKQLYEAKSKNVEEIQQKSFDRIKQLYKKEDAQPIYEHARIGMSFFSGDLNFKALEKILLHQVRGRGEKGGRVGGEFEAILNLKLELVTYGNIWTYHENKVGKFGFAQRFHLQAVKEVITEALQSVGALNTYSGGPGSSVCNTKSNLMKKAKLEFLNSKEVKNFSAMKKNAVQRKHGLSSMSKPVGFSGNPSASTSKLSKPTGRRALEKILLHQVRGRGEKGGRVGGEFEAILNLKLELVTYGNIWTYHENKVGKFGFAQRFHLQAVKEVITEALQSVGALNTYSGGPGSSVCNTKSNLMKKAKLEFLNSKEVKNFSAMKKNAVQRKHGLSSMSKPVGFSGNPSASTSKLSKPTGRRV